MAFDYARDHFPIGAGLDGPQQPVVFNHYFPTEPFRAAHSIYFQVLGDNGFAGLAIYLVLLFLVFSNCSRIRRAARDRPEFAWARDLATAIQLSMVAFCVGGAALSLAYSDFLFIWAGILSRLVESSSVQRNTWHPTAGARNRIGTGNCYATAGLGRGSDEPVRARPLASKRASAGRHAPLRWAPA